ncbi:MAG: hypothetical protein ACYTHM_11105 [Planctomycetota bacterium]
MGVGLASAVSPVIAFVLFVIGRLDKESRFASLPTVILYYLVIGLVLSFFFSIVGIAVSPYITHRAQRDAGKE